MKVVISLALVSLLFGCTRAPKGTPEQRTRASEALAELRQLAKQFPAEQQRMERNMMEVQLFVPGPGSSLELDHARRELARAKIFWRLIDEAKSKYVEACSACAPKDECEKQITGGSVQKTLCE